MTDTSKAVSNQLICPCGFTYDQGLLGNLRHMEECEEARKEFSNKHLEEMNKIEIVLYVNTAMDKELKKELKKIFNNL